MGGFATHDAVRLFITMIHTDTQIQPFRSLLLVVASGFRSRGEYSHDLAFDIDDHPLPRGIKVGTILPRAPFFSLMSRFRLAKRLRLHATRGVVARRQWGCDRLPRNGTSSPGTSNYVFGSF
jgi:hypothetical protein